MNVRIMHMYWLVVYHAHKHIMTAPPIEAVFRVHLQDRLQLREPSALNKQILLPCFMGSDHNGLVELKIQFRGFPT